MTAVTDYPLAGPGYAASAAVLDACARIAAEQVEGVTIADRRMRRSQGVSVDVSDHGVRARLEIEVRYGTVLHEAAEAARRSVGHALARLTGLTVASVDVVVSAVD